MADVICYARGVKVQFSLSEVAGSLFGSSQSFRVVVDIWEKDVGDFQAKSGSPGSCPHFQREITVQ